MASSPLELGPQNWFTAWWLGGTQRQEVSFGRASDGEFELLRLRYDAARALVSVLARAWWDGPAQWEAPEAEALRELEQRLLERADDLRRAGTSPSAAPPEEPRVVWPSTEHPMFTAAGSCHLLEEAWRLEQHEGFTEWLAAAPNERDFAMRARSRVHLRRLAVLSAQRIPSKGVYEILRRTYRFKRSFNDVVAADRAFLAGHSDSGFATGIAELGLHAPLTRPRFAPRKPRRPPANQAPARITVLIPSYRHERFIEAAIRSCLEQTIDAVKVLVADDVSPDRTVEVARSITDPRVEVIVNETNVGLGASVLAALSRVDTPYVALLNSDDLFHPRRLTTCVALLEADPRAALVASRFVIIDEKDAVLTAATSCAVDVGPMAHGWLRWFDAIERDELTSSDSWVSLNVLLRHNVLVTSSNMVFRTDWLRAHMPAASRLKYCLDWQLFLQAALEQSLRFVDEPLLAYRLHGSNTVWFRDGGRADYVMEVSRVVDRILREWLTRESLARGSSKAMETLVEILENDVASHGETDSTALFAIELADRQGADPVDTRSPAIEQLASAAFRRKTLSRALAKLEFDPWRIPWQLGLAERWRVERDAADGHAARATVLAQQERELRVAVAQSTAQVSAQDVALQAANERYARLATDKADVERALGEAQRRFDASLADRQQQIEAGEKELQRCTLALAEAQRSLDETSTVVTALRGELADARTAHDALAAAASALRSELFESRTGADRLRTELSQVHDALGAERSASEALRGRIEGLLRDLAESRELGQRAEDLRDRALQRAVNLDEQLQLLLRSAAWRFGAVLSRRVGLLTIYKTAAAWSRRLIASVARLKRRLMGWAAAWGSSRTNVVTLLDAAPGDDVHVRIPGGLADGSVKLAWMRNVPRSVRRTLDARWLVDDARVAAADRAYFTRRDPAAVDQITRLFGAGASDGCWQAARTIGLRQDQAVIAFGLRNAAAQAFASKLLTGAHSILVLGDEDLVTSHWSPEVCQELLRSADQLVVDSECIASAIIRRLSGGPVPPLIVRWARAASPEADPGVGSAFRVFVDWTSSVRSDAATLVRAIQLAVTRGVQIEVDIAGSLGQGVHGLHRWLELESQLDRAGIGSRCRLHGVVAAAARDALRRHAHVATWVGHSSPDCGLPEAILEAVSAGICVVATEVVEIAQCDALAAGIVLIPPDDPEALAQAWNDLAADRSDALERLRRARGHVAQLAAQGAAVPLPLPPAERSR